jgi:hypothetical protein
MEAARFQRRRADQGRERFAEREQLMREAVSILRELVGAHPDRPEYRFELCQAILSLAGPLRGRVDDQDLELLREADRAAERLVREQPFFKEYVNLHGSARSALGRALHQRSRQLAQVGDDESCRRLQGEAENALQSALEIALPLAPESGPSDPRFVGQLIQTRSALARLYGTMADTAKVKQQVTAMLDLIEGQIVREDADDGPPRPWESGRAPRRPRRGDRGLLAVVAELVRGLDDEQLTARIEELQARGEQRPR